MYILKLPKRCGFHTHTFNNWMVAKFQQKHFRLSFRNSICCKCAAAATKTAWFVFKYLNQNSFMLITCYKKYDSIIKHWTCLSSLKPRTWTFTNLANTCTLVLFYNLLCKKRCQMCFVSALCFSFRSTKRVRCVLCVLAWSKEYCANRLFQNFEIFENFFSFSQLLSSFDLNFHSFHTFWTILVYV